MLNMIQKMVELLSSFAKKKKISICGENHTENCKNKNLTAFCK